MFESKAMYASIIIRTYNEEQYLRELLTAIGEQDASLVQYEIVLIDSGSSDNTLSIAEEFGCRIGHIKKEDFTFGRSLNVGCELATGGLLLFISGHCIPKDKNWLTNLCRPLVEGKASYVYGKQIGRDTTKFSENQLFAKFYPGYSKLPQDGFFVNNANAAITRSAWERFKFNEELTGLEDMYLAKLIVESGERTGYVSDAEVWHIHDESWQQIRIRYEREAYALQNIMPEVHFTMFDFLHFLLSSIISDMTALSRDNVSSRMLLEIFLFRLNHYWGTYRGGRETRKMSASRKKQYFYAKDLEKDVYYDEDSSTADESA